MKEIKQKFINAIQAIDFEKLNIGELDALANIVTKVKELDSQTDSYLNTLAKGLGNGMFAKPEKETLKDLR